MRKRFETQLELGSCPIEDIEMPAKSRDELPPVLRALQEIYINAELNEKIFGIMESKIQVGLQGRPGMSLWQILVLGVVRSTLNTNYDRVHHIANYDMLVRQLFGHPTFGLKQKKYSLQSIKDNVELLTEEMLDEINEAVVSYGHSVKKKPRGKRRSSI